MNSNIFPPQAGIFAPKALLFGSLNFHFSVRPSVRPFVRSSAATKMKTVTDETIKTRPKNTDILVVFEGTDHFHILCQLILMPKNDPENLSFYEGKNDPEGSQKRTQKYLIFVVLTQIYTVKRMSRCALQRDIVRETTNFTNSGCPLQNLKFTCSSDIFGSSAPHALRV